MYKNDAYDSHSRVVLLGRAAYSARSPRDPILLFLRLPGGDEQGSRANIRMNTETCDQKQPNKKDRKE